MSQSKPPPPTADSSRNQYIPSFISKKPFYIDETTSDADYLEHQRLQSVPKDTLDKAKWYSRGKAGPAATKFRKGACENCGAMTHKTKECLSRPRKQGAKWTGRDIQADEVVEDVKLGWDAKRDRWNGYDAREYSTVVKEYEELESMKRATVGLPEGEQKQLENGEAIPDSDARYGEETDMGRSQPTSTRQLRLREDTAKYLLNLDLDSARYDPKTRSMDTTAQSLSTNPNADGTVAEEGFIRPTTTSDDAAAFERAQKYAWETQEKAAPGSKKLHLQANPTEGEILRRQQEKSSTEKKTSQRQALLAKYGDQSLHLPNTAQKQTLVTESSRYVEYDDAGGIKGQPKKIARSKYAEDVLTNNHTSVWGSWWRDFVWGYACCHSTVRNSYCTGEHGRLAFEEAEGMRTGEILLLENNKEEAPEASDRTGSIKEPNLKLPTAKGGEDSEKLSLEQSGEDIQERKDREKGGLTATGSSLPNRQAKKRTLQEIQSGVTEEEMESYKRNRTAADDPMARMLGRDELLD